MTATLTRPADHGRVVAHAGFALTREIVARSAADDWDAAKWEWELETVYRTAEDEPGECLCGHRPIREVCVLRNRETGETVDVGNVCVKRFLGLPADAILAGLDRVARDPAAALTPEAVEFAFVRGWVNEWERGFALDTARKRKLSPRQRAMRVRINRAVLAHAGRCE